MSPVPSAWVEPEAPFAEDQLEILAEALASGKIRSQADVDHYAEILHISSHQLLKRQWNPKVTKMVLERIQIRAAYIVAKNLDALEEAMQKGKSWAFKLAAQLSTALPVGGVSFQQNQFIDARSAGVSDSAMSFSAHFLRRVYEGRPALRLLSIHDPPDPDQIPDPTAPGGPVEPDPEPAA